VRILEALTKEASERGCTAMFACTSNARAAGFFERNGFRSIDADELPARKWKGRRPPLPECFWREM
jgi:N-acetylglutamate synthase-like GNAT family acetyltransferase